MADILSRPQCVSTRLSDRPGWLMIQIDHANIPSSVPPFTNMDKL